MPTGSDHRLVGQVGDGDATASPPGVRPGDGRHDPLISDHLGGQAHREIRAHRQDRGVETAGPDAVDQGVGVIGAERDVDERMRAVEVGQQAGHVEVVRRDAADGDRAPHQIAEFGHRRAGVTDGAQGSPGVRQERLPRRGESHRAPVAVEQRLAEFAFQTPDLGADRGLRDVFAFGGPREVGLLRHGDEVVELPQFHKR